MDSMDGVIRKLAFSRGFYSILSVNCSSFGYILIIIMKDNIDSIESK